MYVCMYYVYVQCHDTLGSQVVVVCVDIMTKLNVFKTCRKFKIRVKMSVMLVKCCSAVGFK